MRIMFVFRWVKPDTSQGNLTCACNGLKKKSCPNVSLTNSRDITSIQRQDLGQDDWVQYSRQGEGGGLKVNQGQGLNLKI